MVPTVSGARRPSTTVMIGGNSGEEEDKEDDEGAADERDIRQVAYVTECEERLRNY